MKEPREIEFQTLTGCTAWFVLINQFVNIHRQVVCGVGELVALGHDLEVDIGHVWVVFEHADRGLDCAFHWGHPDSSEV